MLKGLLNRAAIDLAAKQQYGVRPSKKVAHGVTVYQASMAATTMLLTVIARKSGPLDERRAHVIERVAARFSENVMFTQVDPRATIEVMWEIDQGLDNGVAFEIEGSLTDTLKTLGDDLPEKVRKEMVAHIALLLKLDPLQISYDDRRAIVRDELGRLLGRVTNDDIERVFNVAAGYSLNWPGSS